MRGRGVVLLFVVGIATAIGVVAIVVQPGRQPVAPPPQAVANAADISATPREVSVVLLHGWDRVLQRRATGWSTCPGGIGCPASIDIRSDPVFLVRDRTGAIHAFIGEDPRTGCALRWRSLPPSESWSIDGIPLDGLFYDPCHGTEYDRTGRLIGGPGPWYLNALRTEVRNGILYVDPATILTGGIRPEARQ